MRTGCRRVARGGGRPSQPGGGRFFRNVLSEGGVFLHRLASLLRLVSQIISFSAGVYSMCISFRAVL